MKRAFLSIFAVSALAISVGFTSCKKESDDSPTTEQQIEGKWQFQKAISNGVAFGETIDDTTYFEEGDYIQFNSDKSLEIHEEGEDVTGTWQIENGKLLITETDDYMDFPGGFDIKTITNNKLELYYAVENDYASIEQTLILVK